MAKFILIKISLMAEITDAGALREAALKHFDADDITSDDYPETADWHASEVGQEDRRLIATEDNYGPARSSLTWPRPRSCSTACPVPRSQPGLARVVELEGTTKREARDDWGKREGIPWLADSPESED